MTLRARAKSSQLRVAALDPRPQALRYLRPMSPRTPFKEGDRIRDKRTGEEGVVVFGPDANGDLHVAWDEQGVAIEAPRGWGDFEVVEPHPSAE
jgi:hypothetical protein